MHTDLQLQVHPSVAFSSNLGTYCSCHLINRHIHRTPAQWHSSGSELFLIIDVNYRLTPFIMAHYIPLTLITTCIKYSAVQHLVSLLCSQCYST